MTPPPPVDTDVSKEKKGKKGKGKKGHFALRWNLREGKRSKIGKAFFIWTEARCKQLFIRTPSLFQLPGHFAATALFLLLCKKLWKKLIYFLRLYWLFLAAVKHAYVFMMYFFINFNIFFHFLNSAKKGKDIREEMAEVRPDPDIEDVDRTVAETSRSGELFVLRVCFPFPLVPSSTDHGVAKGTEILTRMSERGSKLWIGDILTRQKV